jgi:hypothetical protein
MTTMGGKRNIEIRREWFLLAALCALVAVCFIVIASSGTAQSQQKGTLICVKLNKPRKGSVRIPASGLCHGNERGLFLNQTGPQGPPGIQGPPGAPGAPGTPGAPCPNQATITPAEGPTVVCVP